MLVGLLLALTWQAASALLGLASLPSASWCGLCWQPDWSSYQLGTRVRVPGVRSWSLQGLVPYSTASSTSGSLRRFFAIDDQRAAIRWLVLGGPWKACLWPHKIGQPPTRRLLKKNLSLLAFLSWKKKLPSLLAFLSSLCRKRAMDS